MCVYMSDRHKPTHTGEESSATVGQSPNMSVICVKLWNCRKTETWRKTVFDANDCLPRDKKKKILLENSR